MLTRRRLLTGSAAAAFALPGSALALPRGQWAGGVFTTLLNSVINTVIPPAEAQGVVQFLDGIENGTYPSSIGNKVLPNVPFAPAGPAILDNLGAVAPWGFTSLWLNSITPPFGIRSHPIMGVRNAHGYIYTLRIVPPGLQWRAEITYPYIYVNPDIMMHVTVQDPLNGLMAGVLAAIGNIYDGIWRQINIHINPTGYPAGTTLPMNIEVTMLQRGGPYNIVSVLNLLPTGRTHPYNIFNIPWGDMQDNSGTNPPWWLGFQPPIFGGPFSMGLAQNTAYNGYMGPVIFSNSSAIDPSALAPGFLVDTNGFALQRPTLPDGMPPAIRMIGGKRSFLANRRFRTDTLTIDTSLPDTSFATPGGFVEIEDINIFTPGFNTIGIPFSGPD